MYFAYSFTESSKSPIKMFYFYAFELLPLVWDIFLRELKNFSIVSGYFSFFLVKNESIVF